MPPANVPAWHGPRTDVLGVPALSPVLIARTPDVAVAATDVTAYPDGFSFELDIRLRDTGDAHHQPSNRNATDLEERMYTYSESLTADRRRPWRHWPEWFTLEYPGGIVARSDPPFWTGDPEFPVLVSNLPGSVAGGGGNEWWFSLWACPLPRPGTMALVCSGWPELGVPPARGEVDTAPLLDAAKRVVDLWSV
jgi:hypothetical protein